MKITVLAENSFCSSDSMNIKGENGLSLLIEFDKKKILFDTGQSDIFIHNAGIMGIDLSQVDYLIISHCHSDNGRCLNHFQRINKKAKVFMHINAAKKYYTRIYGFIPDYVGLDKKRITHDNRIYFIEEDTRIEDKIILLEGFSGVFPQKESNKSFSEKTDNQFIVEFSNHELVMLLIENDEIVLFSGYSHSGIVNILDEVKLFSKSMKIKAVFGGYHLHNTCLKTDESEDYFGRLAKDSGDTDPVFCTCQYTGEGNPRVMKGWICRQIQRIKTGEIIQV